MQNTTPFSPLLTNLRACAILIVVLGHSIILYDPSWAIYKPLEGFYPFMILKRIINLIQMPLFFSISGYLFYWSVRKRSFKNTVKIKAIRIMIPFLIVLLFFSNPLKTALCVPGYDSIYTVMKHNLLLADLGHLWFLPVLFFLFVLNYYTFTVLKTKKTEITMLLLLIALSYGSSLLPSFFLFNLIAYYWVFFYFGV